ncbi:hypothetical protein [Billgrantia sp. C5P2]|uniref:hypothetical protein n=1 Tax=Billgrantia sp. C5P2 TaxID=3436239 RepID=UPI003DA2E47D
MNQLNIGKKIIIVLGPGRSGTSLLMQILEHQGIALSEKLNQPSAANKYGPKEDKDIFEVHSILLKELGSNPLIPLPDGWMNKEATLRAKKKLRDILLDRLENNSVFALKDPRMSFFLPLWNLIFNELKITPVYLFAIREFKATAGSHLRQYNLSPEAVESSWLSRTIDALRYVGTECFFVHYEDWFSSPESTLEGLREHLRNHNIALTKNCDLSELVDKSADRSKKDDIIISNICVQELNNFLADFRGYDYDREKLIDKINYCQGIMQGFMAWCNFAHINIAAREKAQQQLRNARKKIQDLSDCESRKEYLEAELLLANKAGKEFFTTMAMMKRIDDI